LRFTGGLEPVERCSNVGVVAVETLEPLLRRVGNVWFGLLDEREEELRVAAAQLRCFVGFPEPFVCVLADCLEHPEAVALADANEALVDKGLKRVEVCLADRLRRLERAAACEDGKPREEPLLGGFEQLVRPLDRRPERLLARIDSPACPEQVDALRETLEQLPGRDDPDARRSELERERQLLEACA